MTRLPKNHYIPDSVGQIFKNICFIKADCFKSNNCFIMYSKLKIQCENKERALLTNN